MNMRNIRPIQQFEESSKDGKRRVSVCTRYDFVRVARRDCRRTVTMCWEAQGSGVLLEWKFVEFCLNNKLDYMFWAGDAFIDTAMEVGDRFLADGIEFVNVADMIKVLVKTPSKCNILVRIYFDKWYYEYSDQSGLDFRIPLRQEYLGLIGEERCSCIHSYITSDAPILEAWPVSLGYLDLVGLSLNDFVLKLFAGGKLSNKASLDTSVRLFTGSYCVAGRKEELTYYISNFDGIVVHMDDSSASVLRNRVDILARSGFFATRSIFTPVLGVAKRLDSKSKVLKKNLFLRISEHEDRFALYHFVGPRVKRGTKFLKPLLVWDIPK